MKRAKSSVLYLLNADASYSLDTAQKAQKAALEHRLPHAWVYCLTGHDTEAELVSKLVAIEKVVTSYGIPLLVLSGEPEDVLPGLYRHVQPEVFESDVGMSEISLKDLSRVLVVHPHPWSGRVLNVSEVVDFAKSGEKC